MPSSQPVNWWSWTRLSPGTFACISRYAVGFGFKRRIPSRTCSKRCSEGGMSGKLDNEDSIFCRESIVPSLRSRTSKSSASMLTPVRSAKSSQVKVGWVCRAASRVERTKSAERVDSCRGLIIGSFFTLVCGFVLERFEDKIRINGGSTRWRTLALTSPPAKILPSVGMEILNRVASFL